jgi:hypothetical protein
VVGTLQSGSGCIAVIESDHRHKVLFNHEVLGGNALMNEREQMLIHGLYDLCLSRD